MSLQILTKVRAGMLNFFRSLPASKRTPEEWEAFDREFRAERDAWE